MCGERKISVVLATKNRLELLRGAVESLAAQTCPFYEAIVVNDGGQSVTDLIRECGNSGQIKLIELETSRGLAAARNAGLEIATGTGVSFLDDDDVYLPNAIASFVEHEPKQQNIVYFDCIVQNARRQGTNADHLSV